ncbi:MAG: hypothetical protein ACLFP1_05425 [Candidatus Goldiibacteriota bacterium]
MFFSCAVFGPHREGPQPLEKRIFSGDISEAEKARAEWEKLPQREKKEILKRTARLLGQVKDPDTQMRITAALKALDAGPYIITCILEAADKNTDFYVYNHILELIWSMEFKGEPDAERIRMFLKKAKGKAEFMALEVLGMMSENAEKAVPDIIDVMKKEGTDYEKYSAVFNVLARIDYDTALTAAMLSLREKDPELRKNAAIKLLEINRYITKKTSVSGEIMPALFRLFSEDDEQTREMIKEIAAESQSRKAEQELTETVSRGREMFSGLMGMLKIDRKKAGLRMDIKHLSRLRDFYMQAGAAKDAEKLEMKIKNIRERIQND